MASLRDVLNHIGKPMEVRRGGALLGSVLATQRGAQVLAEPKLDIQPGDEVRLPDGRLGRVAAVEAELVKAKVDHLRLQVDLL